MHFRFRESQNVGSADFSALFRELCSEGLRKEFVNFHRSGTIYGITYFSSCGLRRVGDEDQSKQWSLDLHVFLHGTNYYGNSLKQ